jgi:hypothetical protein
MDHTQRRERRQKIAEHASTHDIADTAKEFGMSIATIRNACLEFGVTPVVSSNYTTRFSAYKVIADLLDGMAPAAVAVRHRVSKQRIHQIRTRCLESGIKIPVRKVEYR